MKITNFKLNKGIAELMYPVFTAHRVEKTDAIYTVGNMTKQPIKRLDYCNNWNDLMPLIEEYKIDLVYESATKRGLSSWRALVSIYYSDGEFHEYCSVFNENPKIALAECLLKVLENKKL